MKYLKNLNKGFTLVEILVVVFILGLLAASATTSTAITVLPGDAASPIAEKLMDLSTYFMIVLAAIYLEKYLFRHQFYV